MRLLNARTRTLEEFFDDNIPRYAILSHTWGPNEPTYRDFATPGNRDANVKIDGCCERALLDGYEHVWIDTICIDKSSSAELSEAINSMFAWYEKAGVCYAYLSDVSSDECTPVAQLADPVSDFRRSKWFTRGWTLQELIAPRRVVFYNFCWLKLMEKKKEDGYGSRGKGKKYDDMHRVLEQITRIPFGILKGAPLRWTTVAARMAWAAHRQTTRKEDIAYCLLGIFDINMSMLYGEGDRAFTRLQEEIIRTSDDESIFAWGFNSSTAGRILQHGGTPSPGNHLLAVSPADFLGCEKVQTVSPAIYYGSSNSMSTHYSLTNKGLLVDRPLVVLPAPFHMALVPLNCTPDRQETCSQLLALPLLRGDEARDGAQLTLDPACCPLLIATDLINGDTVKTKIYISPKRHHPAGMVQGTSYAAGIEVKIQDASSGRPASGVHPTWFIPPSMSRIAPGTALEPYFWSPWAKAGLVALQPPVHTLVDLACPNRQRYMVHLVQSFASGILSLTAGVCRRDPEGTAVEDIIRMKQDGHFAGHFSPQVYQTLWPTTSDDGVVRLELPAPDHDFGNSSDADWAHDWQFKIHVSCGEQEAIKTKLGALALDDP